MNKLIHFLSKKKTKLWLSLLVLFLVAAAFRAYRINDHLFFGFEQGRDAQRVAALVSFSDLILVGPKTDIDGIFHGPWYYYLMMFPYGLSNGNPVIASMFLILLSSIVPLVMFDLFKRVTGDVRYAWLAALTSLLSYELISYSRWLSNVTPAIPLMAVVLWLLWRYSQKPTPWMFIVAASAAGLAAQFEIILTLWWVTLLILLVGFKVIVWPKMKVWLTAITAAFFWYFPLVLFNIRYNFISITSASKYFSEGKPSSFNLFQNGVTYLKMIENAVSKTVVNLPQPYVIFFVSLMVVGLILLWKKNIKSHSTILLFISWVFMTMPVVLFSKSMTLTQLYIGASLGIISLLVLSVQGWLQVKKGWVALVILVTIWGVQTSRNLYLIHTNQDVFYVTIQDDLNYADQQRVLSYVQSKAEGKPYFLKAFTIPYYQEEGWQYLHSYLYLTTPDPGANQGFVIIEEKVDPYWREQWQRDLGETTLEEERYFGKLLVQYRKRVL